jgi:hypothetical protein
MDEEQFIMNLLNFLKLRFKRMSLMFYFIFAICLYALLGNKYEVINTPILQIVLTVCTVWCLNLIGITFETVKSKSISAKKYRIYWISNLVIMVLSLLFCVYVYWYFASPSTISQIQISQATYYSHLQKLILLMLLVITSLVNAVSLAIVKKYK